MKNLSGSWLAQIKAVHENCTNGVQPSKLKYPYGNTGIFRTPTMITCLDNKRRRVWCNASFSDYYLFINMDGERVQIKDNHYYCTPYSELKRLIK